MREEIMIPNAPILMESTRAVGYSFESALADIIDNSISKDARRIDICFDYVDKPFVAVVDDGEGMTEEELKAAMNYGSKSSLAIRGKCDLGRFGLGLKMASLSQCRQVTVITKKNGCIAAASWDLDYVIKKNSWSAIFFDQHEIRQNEYASYLKDYTSGTIVIWEKFDKLNRETVNFAKTFDSKIEAAKNHISLIFHRFLDNDFGKTVKICFNNVPVIPMDPFLTNNPATQPLPEQVLCVEGNKIQIKPYILPIASKLRVKDKQLIGDISDLRQNQGFYIYRSKRLIIWGTWFRLIKNHELNKLTRVKVDIPNSLDDLWDIDIKKSTASLPDIVKKELISIVKNAVGVSERVYKYRGRKINSDNLDHAWNVVDDRGSLKCIVNRESILYNYLKNSLNNEQFDYFEVFLKLLEAEFPYGTVYYAMAKGDNQNEREKMEFEDAYRMLTIILDAYIKLGMGIEAALNKLEQTEFSIQYTEVIKKIRENYQNE
jgi:hypothetical protein